MASSKKNIKKEPVKKQDSDINNHSIKKRVASKNEISSNKNQIELFNDNNTYKEITTDDKKNVNFDSKLPIYIQIHANNIYNYFSSALISPQINDNVSIFSDIQSLNPNYLLLSNGFIARIDEKDILLEVVLKNDELDDSKIINGVFVFSKPLPISRIKKILVKSEYQKKEIINNSLIGDAGFISPLVFSLFNYDLPIFDLPTINISHENYSDLAYKRFDKILGTFSFLSNYSILLANETNSIKTFPDHYFIAARALNKNYDTITDSERILVFYKILFGINHQDQPLLQWLVDRMLEGSNFTNNDIYLFADLLSKTSPEDFQNEASNILRLLMSPVDRKNGIKEIPKLKNSEKFYLYLFAILRQYGNLNTEDKAISRADLPQMIFHPYGEFVFACLGFFYGYKTQRNFEDRINIRDSFFANFFNTEKRINIKFKLDTALDLSIIESIYQLTFNCKENIEIEDYSSYIQIIKESLKPLNEHNTQYLFKETIYLDKPIYSIEKNDPSAEIDKLLLDVDIIPAISIFGSFCYRNQVKLSSVTLLQMHSTKPNYIYFFRKTDILSAIKNGKVKLEDVIQNILLSNKENEF